MRKKHYLAMAVLVAALIGALWLWYSRDTATASAPSGLIARVSTTSVFHLEAGVADHLFGFATSTLCGSRVISTGPLAIRIGFMDGATATPSSGHVQAASTTVAYDAQVYGCGRYTAYPMSSDGSTAILTIVESQ